MGNRKDQNLFDHIKFINEEAAHKLNEELPYDQHILSLTMEDLNKLLPGEGENNIQVRRHIMGLINIFLQEQDRQIVDSSPADVMKADSYDPDFPTSAREDLNELQPGAHVDQVQRHIMGLINVFLQMQAGQSVDSSPADVIKELPYDQHILSLTMEDLNKLLPGEGENNIQVRRHIMGLINAFLQFKVLYTKLDKNVNPNITNESELLGKGTEPTGEETESEQSSFVPAMEHSTGLSRSEGCVGA
ncbi:uncharacterized protein [Paramormyrops kingsleyae]|uniref:uncharacterized protein n=1 Tax=Paramormyrops kingsleyae TaxID=1676925 RepID=UPI003B97B458